MTRLYLHRIDPEAQEAVHGRDYNKGFSEGDEPHRHEFHTRECHPVYVTEEELMAYPEKYREHFVEIVPLHKDVEGAVTTEEPAPR